MRSYVFDANALLTYLYARAGAERMRTLLESAQVGVARLLLCVVNWAEVYYALWRVHGPQVAEEKLLQISRLPVALVAVDAILAKRAATLRAKYRLPYADCFAAAVAQQEKAPVVTADSDFRAVEREVKILWLR